MIEKIDRNNIIYTEVVERKFTLRATAKKYELTPERVRQIIGKIGSRKYKICRVKALRKRYDAID